jgi:pyruvate, orthophosphate dikinase
MLAVGNLFSFGTNDLTQTVFGLSRDDAGKILPLFVEQGVGEMVRIAAERGRKVKPKLKLGICGEHGGDPASIAFCEAIGLDYVSCSPFRVPVARLAAAQAALGVESDRTA